MPIPFLVLTDLRTGSTLLCSSLDRHPEIRCYGELLHERDMPDNVPAGLDRRAASGSELIARAFRAGGVRAAGFKAIASHPPPSVGQWGDAWSYLSGVPELRVIDLVRGDRLAQFASLAVAQATGVFHPHDGDGLYDPDRRPTIEIDPETLVRWVRERDELLALRRRQVDGKPRLAIEYEELAGDWDRTIERVQRFLGVEPVGLPMAKRKQERRPLREVVSNHDEVIRALGR